MVEKMDFKTLKGRFILAGEGVLLKRCNCLPTQIYTPPDLLGYPSSFSEKKNEAALPLQHSGIIILTIENKELSLAFDLRCKNNSSIHGLP